AVEDVQGAGTWTGEFPLRRISFGARQDGRSVGLRRTAHGDVSIAAHRRARERVGILGRGNGGKRRHHSAESDQEAAALHARPRRVRNGHTPSRALASASATRGDSDAMYPLCALRRSACGHITIRPPIAMSAPPSHTHITSGLNVRRTSAVSVPVTPTNTRYTSWRQVLRIPTSVLGSKVGFPKVSTYWRFSLTRSPCGSPLRCMSSADAVVKRFSVS